MIIPAFGRIHATFEDAEDEAVDRRRAPSDGAPRAVEALVPGYRVQPGHRHVPDGTEVEDLLRRGQDVVMMANLSCHFK